MELDDSGLKFRTWAQSLIGPAADHTAASSVGPALTMQIVIAGVLGLSFGYALAQPAPQPSTYDPSVDVAAARRPGHLTPHEVIDKRLLDYMGNSLGVIQAVSPDGRNAIVMPVGNALPFTVAMSRLSIGMGSHTVIQDARNDLDPAP